MLQDLEKALDWYPKAGEQDPDETKDTMDIVIVPAGAMVQTFTPFKIK